MINRIRDIRRQKGLTLADVAQRCDPPTTAQTVGRLETGMRGLSLAWMNRIAAALGVDPQALVADEQRSAPTMIARLTAEGAEALTRPMTAVLPTDLVGTGALAAMIVEAGAGEYRAGDQVWIRQVRPDDLLRALNRDVLVPRPGGRFVFGRLLEGNPGAVKILPPGTGSRQVSVEHPAWLGVAEMLVRRL